MLYILIVFLAVFFLWVILVYLRKTMWDAIHRNLLDLEDQIGGKVIRRNFLTRPAFHGKFDGVSFTINFSSEKISGSRMNYIDLSFDTPANYSVTISSKSWLDQHQTGQLEDYKILRNDADQEFIIRPASREGVKALIKKKALKDFINEFRNLAYLFVGQSGLICEWIPEEIIKATEYETLLKRLKVLKNLGDHLV